MIEIKEKTMNDKGFAKLVRVVKFEGIPFCIHEFEAHHFESVGQIMKYDPSSAAPPPDGEGVDGDVVLLQSYVCSKCLTHVYIELARTPKGELVQKCAHAQESDHGKIQ